jgi:hypothetical protein
MKKKIIVKKIIGRCVSLLIYCLCNFGAIKIMEYCGYESSIWLVLIIICMWASFISGVVYGRIK